jgi:adenylate cyclase
VPGTLALYGAIAVHGLLALWVLYDRRTLRMPAWEATQYALGLVLPVLLVSHVVGTRIAWWRFDAEDPYARVLLGLWVLTPGVGIRHAVTLVLAWIHACIGTHYWLRFRSWYPRAAPWLFSVALLLPTLALLGFVAAGREVAARAQTPGWAEAMLRAARAPDPAEAARLLAIREEFLHAYLIALLGVLAARVARSLLERRRSFRITYPGSRVVTAPRGFTILEASRLAAIPHASVCGGRGRCSTCRVRIGVGLAALPAPSEAERRVLSRVGAAPDVRLAVEPLLSPAVTPGEAFATDVRQGREQELTILFADLRGFTRMAENKLPYDVVFVLNRYFEAVGTAITGAGGVTNQFTGDGVMALFGIGSEPAAGSRQALAAARAMVEGVRALSRELATDLGSPLRIGIGIHTGPAVVGRMGWGESFYLTAVGDTVHVAARLEQATKDYGAELVVSEAVARRAAIDLSHFPAHDLAVRNRAGHVSVRVVDRVENLPSGVG